MHIDLSLPLFLLSIFTIMFVTWGVTTMAIILYEHNTINKQIKIMIDDIAIDGVLNGVITLKEFLDLKGIIILGEDNSDEDSYVISFARDNDHGEIFKMKKEDFDIGSFIIEYIKYFVYGVKQLIEDDKTSGLKTLVIKSDLIRKYGELVFRMHDAVRRKKNEDGNKWRRM